MLNDPRVREILSSRGLHISRETFFLGGLHNTAVDSVNFYDLDMLPKSHLKDFEAANESLNCVGGSNAHERCRRFGSAPLNLSPSASLQHVQGRAEDLAQARPEFGNATNAMCLVGRRERTRGLFLRPPFFLAFLRSHARRCRSDGPCTYPDAVVPVTQGINLQYFFSAVDPSGWGCGTKLPHNITSMLGVMDGAASDLRQGLPWQSVEIHEPLRLLFIIETTAEAMHKIMDRNPVVGRILRNGWAQLVVMDPESSELSVFRDRQFHPYVPENATLPMMDTSSDWYIGSREHLAFAQIGG